MSLKSSFKIAHQTHAVLKSFTISWVLRISVRYFPPYVGFWKVVVACLKIGFSPCNENAASLRNTATLRTTEQHSIRFNGQIPTYGVSYISDREGQLSSFPERANFSNAKLA